MDTRPLTWEHARVVSWIREDLPYPYLDLAGYPYAPHLFAQTANVDLSFWHRLVVLFSGRITVKATMQCEHKVERLRSSSHAYVHYPLWVLRLGSWVRARC